MKTKPFFPDSLGLRILWLENFRSKLNGHATALGISPAICAAAIADARWIIYILGSWLPAAREWLSACVASADLIHATDTVPGNAANPLHVLPLFVPPTLPGVVGTEPAVVPVKIGALSRIFFIVRLLKDAAAYDEVHGQDLGIIGTEDTGPNYATLQPVITVEILNGHVKITWGWGGFSLWLDACELQVDRGAGWVPLAIDTNPNYIDPTPFPATLTKWKYRGIYNKDAARVGLWSPEASVVVGGA